VAAQLNTSRSWLVLVVDDNQDAAESLAQLLRLSGHQVEVAYNGMCALARVRTFHPEIVLCDLGLPELSGYDFAKAIRREQPRTIRLIAISGYAQPDDIRRSLEAGFDAHVAKPAKPADIERWLS
jgi:CheY-like chemotaxis protein